MIGPHGGKGGTVKIDNFTDHIPVRFFLLSLPLPAKAFELSIQIAISKPIDQGISLSLPVELGGIS